MTYSLFDSYRNKKVPVKYVVDNLLIRGIRVHTHSHRAYLTEISVNVLAIPFSPVLLTVSSDFYLRNGAPPLRVAAAEALHYHITTLSVGIHRAFFRNVVFYLIQLATR